MTPRPTTAPPGSRQKIAVLRRRQTHGLPLFHPADVTLATVPDAVALVVGPCGRFPRVVGTRVLQGTHRDGGGTP